MSKKACLLNAVVAFSVLGCLAYSSVASDVPTALVVPAKFSVVAFCEDVAKMVPVTLVSYEVSKKTNAPALTLSVWNGTSREWTRTSLEEYRSGSIFPEWPKRVVLVGNNEDVKAASAAMGELATVPTLDTMGLANGLNGIFKFSSSQWKYLANRYELKLKDLNAERRRYGKYGPPGSKSSVPMPKLEETPPVKGPAPMDLPPVEPAPAAKIAPEDK